jgi:hypothetical protein
MPERKIKMYMQYLLEVMPETRDKVFNQLLLEIRLVKKLRENMR